MLKVVGAPLATLFVEEWFMSISSSTDAAKVSTGSNRVRVPLFERVRAAHKNFEAIDANSDNGLSADELTQAKQKRQDAGFHTPFINAVTEHFTDLDADGDGQLGFQEAHPRLDKIA